MDSKGPPTSSRVYQDFEPSMEWVPEDDSDTLLVYLPGFAKEQLRVQLRARNLIISGERKLHQNTWSRFRVEFPVSVNCDLNKISAKFEGNILFVRQPKLIAPAPKLEEAKPTTVAPPTPTPQKSMDESNVGKKEAEVRPTPTTEPSIEKKEVVKNEDVPKAEGVEEKGENEKEKDIDSKTAEDVDENVPKKETSDEDKKDKNVVYGELDKRVLEKYKQATSAFVRKIKTSSNVVNAIVVLVVGLVIGFYVSNSLKSCAKA